MKIIKRLRKTAPAPLLFFAGVQPGVLFGIEFYQPHPKQITALTTAAAATLASRPIAQNPKTPQISELNLKSLNIQITLMG